MPHAHTPASPYESEAILLAQGDTPKPKEKREPIPSPKALWATCYAADLAATHLCRGLEKTAHATNEILGLVCKWGLAISILGLLFSINRPEMCQGCTLHFKEIATLYCAGVLAANFGQCAFQERALAGALPLPVILAIGLQTMPF